MLNKISKGLFDRHVIPPFSGVLPASYPDCTNAITWEFVNHTYYASTLNQVHFETPTSCSSMTIKATAIRHSCTFALRTHLQRPSAATSELHGCALHEECFGDPPTWLPQNNELRRLQGFDESWLWCISICSFADIFNS
jgi:hypothetical protein